jgi:hypothetical protein
MHYSKQRKEVIDIKKITNKQIIALSLPIILGVSIAYAAFLANSVSIPGITVSTGLAALKICSPNHTGQWTDTVHATVSVAGMFPGEERTIVEGYLGNDSGSLGEQSGTTMCSRTSAATSGVGPPLEIVPTTTYDLGYCGSVLDGEVELQFRLNGAPSEWLSVRDWSTNMSSYWPLLYTNEAHSFAIATRIASTATSQNQSCTFNILLTG